ncbi:putative RNA-directed DNA polymerase from transposon X-element [Trichonephila clavipes]|nr:putative RNA-directed DNA polymerase from transposon X-element [Trichonephila clavipes]
MPNDTRRPKRSSGYANGGRGKRGNSWCVKSAFLGFFSRWETRLKLILENPVTLPNNRGRQSRCTLSREIAKDIQAYSRDQWEKHIEALSPVDNTLWWKSSLLRKPFQSIPPLKGALGSIAISPIEKAEVIADSLQEQFEPNHVIGRELFDQRRHDEVTIFINTPHVQEIEPTTPTEVLSYVQRLKPGNPPDLIRFLIV